MSLPNTTVRIDDRTGLLLIDPQIDFLSPEGVAWGVVGESVIQNNTVFNMQRLLEAAKAGGMHVFVSPHYYFPTDHGWKFEGVLEKLMHSIHMFDRKGPLSLEGFEGSGADWMPEFKTLLEDGKTVFCSPHKVYGPQNNDLVLQLRKRHIDKVIIAGMSANVCVESHMRDLLENGFEVAIAWDATAAAIVPELDGMAAALINYRMLANATWSTDETLEQLAMNGISVPAEA